MDGEKDVAKKGRSNRKEEDKRTDEGFSFSLEFFFHFGKDLEMERE